MESFRRILSSSTTTRRLLAVAGAGYVLLFAGTVGQVSGVATGAPRLDLWTGLAYGWWVTITLVAVLVLVGRATAKRWFRLVAPDRASRIVAYAVIGSFAVYAALLVLAVSGVLDPRGLTALLALVLPVAALHGRDLWRERAGPEHRRGEPAGTGGSAEGPHRPTSADSAAPPSWLPWLLGALLVLWLVPFLVQTLLPNTDWDAATYHLPMARRFLAGQIADVDPAFSHWSQAGAAHLFYALYYLLGAESGIRALNMVAALGTLFATAVVARRFWGWRAGVWAGAVVVGTTILWELGLDPRIDGFLAFFVLVGSYGFLLWWSDERHRAPLLWGGMAFGLAVGVKFSGLVYLVVPAAGLALGLALKPARRGSRQLRTVALAAALVVVPSGYWYMRNAVVLGDPVYPVLSGLKYTDEAGDLRPFEPTLADMVSDLPPDEELAADPLLARFFGAADDGRGGEPEHMLNVADVLLHPERYHRSKIGHTASFFLLAVVFLPFVSRRSQEWWVLALGLVPYLLLGSRFYLLRYVLPSLPLLAVSAGAVLGRLRRPVVLGALTAVLLTVDVVGFEPWRAWSTPSRAADRGLLAESRRWRAHRPFAYLSGSEGRLRWLSRAGYHNISTVVPVLAHLNRGVLEGRIAPRDTVLMVSEGKGNLLLSHHLPDARDSGFRWLAELARVGGDLDALHDSLRRRGIRFVLVNYPNLLGQVGYRTAVHEEVKLVLYTTRRFFDRYGQPEFERAGIRVQDLAPSGGS